MSFATINNAEQSFLVFKPWWEEGIVHGFGGKKLKIKKSSGLVHSDLLQKAIGVSSLFVPKQVHGTNIHAFNPKSVNCDILECDGFVSQIDISNSNPIALGIYTADCLPIFIRRGMTLGLVHAGWRGLSAGIIEECISIIKNRVSNGKWQVVIGPAAGPGRYEVGEEVVKAIGSDAVAEKLSSGKYLLSLAGSASNEAERLLGNEVGVFDCEVCTIEDHGYHSYRREGDRAGRNLSFIKC